ncbi:MAG: 50S ribosomal protein L3 [Clostridia bacterium]|nr:50S ribosomal protein L3 [Clostridia bacterium]
MNKAIIGRKLGMTQLFSQDGKVIPVTVIEAGPCPIVQVKTLERDGYAAVKLGFGDVKVDKANKPKMNKPELGVFEKLGIAPKKVLKEFRLDNAESMEVGKVIECDTFVEGDRIDVSGVSKGHGFTGVIKRWNHHRLKETHGVGPVHREVGSMGAISNPSRVFKGKKMSGQWGHENVTIQNLEVVKVDKARNVILVKGAVPGPVKGIVTIRNTVKA